MRKLKIIAFILIVIAAFFLRVYKLTEVPPSLNWDEVAAGYNAYTIANWGADEYGNKFPVVFKSFGDDKHPVHIYMTSLFVNVFGLSEFATRLPSALIGVLTVVAIYFLVTYMFKSSLAGLFASLFMAVSPYHLQFSRGLWETNFALAFYIFGLLCFYIGIKKKSWVLPFAFLNFGISFYSYHSSKVLVPLTVILLLVLYFKEIYKHKIALMFSGLILLFFVVLTVFNPRILGFARASQNIIPENKIKETFLFKKTENKLFGTGEVVFRHYLSYFSPKYLFVNGDTNPRNSVVTYGEFFKIDALLIIAGIVALFFIRSKEVVVLLMWLLLAPVPASLASGDSQNAVRAFYMLGSINILSAVGANYFVTVIKKKWWYIVAAIMVLVPLFTEFGSYIKYYYSTYAEKYAIEWQYGMKQIVTYLKRNPDYAQVYMDKIRQQPYIFFLYYFKTPLPELLETVKYDKSESKSYNTIVSFDKYQFGGNWNIIDSYPNHGVLYIVTPSYYSGLKYASQFELKKLIKYPSGTDAFFIVEGEQ